MAPFVYDQIGANAQLAADTLQMKTCDGIPSWMLHAMSIPLIDEMAGSPPGSYVKDPHGVYNAFQQAIGTCMVDQYIPENPLSMAQEGFKEGTERTATTGAKTIVRDGHVIDSPEAVLAHLEQVVFPQLESEIATTDPDDPAGIEAIVKREREEQMRLGPNILKVPYGWGINHFPHLRYWAYGYANYFMAYVMYPEVIERDFELQATLGAILNKRAARAIVESGMPRVVRTDHDMADSKGTLVDVRSLDQLWFPHFARAIKPYRDAGVRLIWHCDGNLMEMVPRLIEAGIGGFQGFQYEDGMDYVRICQMKDPDGGPLMIWGGVSVTTTLPFGTTDDVRAQLRWLVENGPEQGLFLAASSSIAPSTNPENVKTLVEGLQYYRTHGRRG